MPIDPSIILRSGQGVTPVNSPQEAEAQALKLRGMRQATVMGNQEMALRQATIEDRQLETAKRARELAGNDALAASVKKHAKADQESGDISVDYQGVANDLSAAGFGQLASSWLKMQNENAEALEKLSSARRAHAKEQLSTIGDLAYRSASADDFTASVALAAAHGLVTEEQAHNIVGQVQEAGGEAWQTVAGHYKQFSPAYQTEQAARAKPVTVAPGARVVVPGTNEVLAEGGPRPASYVSENKLVDGKPAVVDHDSTTGKYFIDGQQIPAARIKPIPAAATTLNLASASNVKEAVAGMKDGTIPPQLPGRASKDYVELLAEAHRQGYDLAKAATDWSAVQKHFATLNGSQQTRIRQAITTASDSLGVIQDLADKWKGGRFPLLNKANLVAAKNGVYGREAASIATKLEGQITDVTSELANVYMGGNSPTDHALKLAEKNLSADWDQKVLTDMIDLARTNLQIRKNSILNSDAVTPSSQAEEKANQPPANAPADGTVGAVDGVPAVWRKGPQGWGWYKK